MPVYRFRVEGRVQGVGYRAYCAREAQRMNINGTVRNCSDDSVEVFCELSDTQRLEFLHLLQRGPTSSIVRTVDVEVLEHSVVDQGFHVLRN